MWVYHAKYKYEPTNQDERRMLEGKCQAQVIYKILSRKSCYYYNETNKHSIEVEKYEFQKSFTSV